jgi:CheY-like chemotaxis protein
VVVIFLGLRVTRAPQRLSVLFVDDDPEVLDCFGLYMRANGVEVDTTTNPREALRRVDRKRPDVIVLDVAMPGMDGYAVIDALQGRADTAEIPVVLFTGRLGPNDAARNTRAQAVVRKPCTPKELLGVVRMFGGRA